MKKACICLSSLLLCSGFALTLAGDGATCGGSAGIPCADGEYCSLPFGCDPEDEGVCMAIISCEGADPLPYCGCDGETYDSFCAANAAGVPLDFFGVCDGSFCGGAFGFSCPEGDSCLVPDCGIDSSGTCVPIPTECPATCRPVCSCLGLTYRTECDALQAFPVFLALNRPGRCNEVQGIHFLSAELLEWESEPGATGYNVYLNGDVFAVESSGPACEAAGLQTNTWAIPSIPDLGELWEIEVTAQFPEGEGPMGMGSLCGNRQAGQPCGN